MHSLRDPHGWLDGAIIHQAQLCLKKLMLALRDFKGQPLVFAEILMLWVESLFSYYTLEVTTGFA